MSALPPKADKQRIVSPSPLSAITGLTRRSKLCVLTSIISSVAASLGSAGSGGFGEGIDDAVDDFLYQHLVVAFTHDADDWFGT